jgi:chromosome partitioning protein
MRRTCSICSENFSVQFSYQVEKRQNLEATVFSYFCSQRCLEESHRGRSGSVHCDGCQKGFQVELAAHVIFAGGFRRYACSPACRERLLPGRKELRAAPAPAPAEREIPAVLDPRCSTPPLASVRQLRPQKRQAQVLAVFNHKGGTGKTTTSVTVAAGLAARGLEVLLVDVDGQGNVAMSLGLSAERSLYHVLVMGLALEQAVVEARAGLDVLPANETLAAAELYLAGRAERDRVLADRLAPAKEHYDFIVLDCSPSLSLLNQNALVLADAVLCPVGCDYLSLVGVRQVLRTIKQVNKLLCHPVNLWGVLPTFYDARANICHEALATLREHFGERCLDPIRIATKIKEAPARNLTVLEHAKGTSAASDYERVVERLVAAPLQETRTTTTAQAGGAG